MQNASASYQVMQFIGLLSFAPGPAVHVGYKQLAPPVRAVPAVREAPPARQAPAAPAESHQQREPDRRSDRNSRD